MRIFNYTFFLIFLLFAALQYNDPDPYLWIPIYIYAAFFSYQAAKGKYFKKAYAVGITFYLMYAVFLFFTKDGVWDWLNIHQSENLVQTMKAEKPWIEDTREFGGLLIMLFVMITNYVTAIRKGL